MADGSVIPPETPGQREEIWPARQNSNSPFDMPGARQPTEAGNRMPTAHTSFGAGNGISGAGNPSMTLRNLIFSPIKRPQISRNRPQLFT